MKPRIGILTFHRAMNYGATLQAFALAETIRGLGGAAELIDYRCPALERSARPLRWRAHGGLWQLLAAPFRLRKRGAFRRFMAQSMRLSAVARNEKELAALNDRYDRFVVGSDQVWNEGCTGGDPAWLLPFVQGPGRAFSYAASLGDGVQRWPAFFRRNRAALGQFAALSVREPSAAAALAEQTGLSARVDLDPVFLLRREEWAAHCGPRRCKRPYLFVYTVGEPLHLREAAQRYARQRGLLVVDAKRSPAFWLHCGPADFLSWVQNAQAVFTNSFHGAALALALERELWVEAESRAGGNLRVRELLLSLGLEARLLTSPVLPQAPPLDARAVEKALRPRRAASAQYLGAIVGQGAAHG